ncbi:MAG: NAD(P)/FAD-dependent oxidoreductase [Gammaproteobacteria bacterium]
MEQLKADYLVVGCGAVSMAFVDTMLSESDATFVIVDERHMPGGHWNDAYPFVRLHQPSAFYGVASTPLGSQRIDQVGSNKGFYELASGPEVLTYFEKVMRERFLTSGRVQYFPMCSSKGERRFYSQLSDKEYQVDVGRSVVDGTFYRTSIPATHTRKYEVEEGVSCIIPNDLPRRAASHKHFTVLGGGKTGMDALIWLLDNGAEPDSISWVCPRESWLINRSTTQPGQAFFNEAVGGFAAQLGAMKKATSVEDLFERLEAAGAMFRINESETPTMFHYATISKTEIDQLRRIKNVLRQGRIASVGATEMTTVSGERIATQPETLYIDCTATAVLYDIDEAKPVFQDGLITLQALRAPLVTFSAAIAAYVEANFETNLEKNKLCTPVVLADTPAEYMSSLVGNMMNQKEWSQNRDIRNWLNNCRLNPLGATVSEANKDDADKMKVLMSIKENSVPAVMNLFSLIAKSQA